MSKVTAMPILYGLIRWSSDEQGSGSSLQRQRDSISAYAADLGARLSWLLTLDGVSARHGASLDHPTMIKFRDDVLAGRREAGIPCVDEPGRFSRGDFWNTLAHLSPLMQFGIASRRLLLRPDDQSGLLALFGFLLESEGGYRENKKESGRSRPRPRRAGKACGLASCTPPECRVGCSARASPAKARTSA